MWVYLGVTQTNCTNEQLCIAMAGNVAPTRLRDSLYHLCKKVIAIADCFFACLNYVCKFLQASGKMKGKPLKGTRLMWKWVASVFISVLHGRIFGDQSSEQLHSAHGILNKFCWTIGQLNKNLFNKCLIPQRCNWTNGKLPNFWLNRRQLNKLFSWLLITSYPYLKSPRSGTRATAFPPGSYPYPTSPQSGTRATAFPSG